MKLKNKARYRLGVDACYSSIEEATQEIECGESDVLPGCGEATPLSLSRLFSPLRFGSLPPRGPSTPPRCPRAGNTSSSPASLSLVLIVNPLQVVVVVEKSGPGRLGKPSAHSAALWFVVVVVDFLIISVTKLYS